MEEILKIYRIFMFDISGKNEYLGGQVVQMRSHFKGFYKPTDEELKQIWEDCIFVFDTNVLLNFLRYEQSTSKTLLKILKEIAKVDRLWLPHQIALEFQFNLDEIITKQDSAYDHIINIYKNKIKDACNTIKETYYRHTNLKLDKLDAVENKFIEEISIEINEQKKNHPDLKSITNELLKLLDGKIGEPLSQSELDKIYCEGKERYDKKIPPGYKDMSDTKKKEGRKYHDGIAYQDLYGDLVFWKQIMIKAKEIGKPVILVTEDSKEDWWVKKNGEVISPQPELIHEFLRNTEGMSFYMYRTEQFIKYANEHFELRQPSDQIEKIVQNVEEVRRNNEQEVYDNIKKLAKLYYSDKTKHIDWFNNKTHSSKFDIYKYIINKEDLRDNVVLEMNAKTTHEAVEFFENNKWIIGEIVSAKMISDPSNVIYKLILTNDYDYKMVIKGRYSEEHQKGIYQILRSAGFDVNEEYIINNPTFYLEK